MSHTITFTTGENNILGTSVKYWKVGDHGMSMSALVTMALCIYFSNTWGILQSFQIIASVLVEIEFTTYEDLARLAMGETILAFHDNMTGQKGHVVLRLNMSILGLDLNAKQH